MSVMLNSMFTSLFAFWRASITSFSFCLFTWVVYHLTFRMEMTCTKVSSCFVCSCISWFIHFLISLVSFIVAVPVNHCSASPKKVIRLLLGHRLLVDDNLLRSVPIWSSCITICMVGLYDWMMLLMLVNSPRRGLTMKFDVNGWHCHFINS